MPRTFPASHIAPVATFAPDILDWILSPNTFTDHPLAGFPRGAVNALSEPHRGIWRRIGDGCFEVLQDFVQGRLEADLREDLPFVEFALKRIGRDGRRGDSAMCISGWLGRAVELAREVKAAASQGRVIYLDVLHTNMGKLQGIAEGSAYYEDDSIQLHVSIITSAITCAAIHMPSEFSTMAFSSIWSGVWRSANSPLTQVVPQPREDVFSRIAGHQMDGYTARGVIPDFRRVPPNIEVIVRFIPRAVEMMLSAPDNMRGVTGTEAARDPRFTARIEHLPSRESALTLPKEAKLRASWKFLLEELKDGRPPLSWLALHSIGFSGGDDPDPENILARALCLLTRGMYRFTPDPELSKNENRIRLTRVLCNLENVVGSSRVGPGTEDRLPDAMTIFTEGLALALSVYYAQLLREPPRRMTVFQRFELIWPHRFIAFAQELHMFDPFTSPFQARLEMYGLAAPTAIPRGRWYSDIHIDASGGPVQVGDGNIQVNSGGSYGTQVGDGGIQHNTFRASLSSLHPGRRQAGSRARVFRG